MTMCDHPDCAGNHKTPERLREDLQNMILEHGHQVRYIFPDKKDGSAPFFYTVGRGVFEKAELLATGPLPQRVGSHMLNAAAQMIDNGEIVLTEGAEFPSGTLLEGFSCRVTRCDPIAAEMTGSTTISGDDVEAWQILWPDLQGNFPDEASYDTRYPQPLYPLSEDRSNT